MRIYKRYLNYIKKILKFKTHYKYIFKNVFELKMKVYIIWLIGVITWNFAVPGAAPIEDVIVAILLSLLSMGLKKFFK